MKVVTPKVYLIAETSVATEGLTEYLGDVDAPDWGSDAPSDPELLIEAAGRLCYRSWAPGLNPNVTRVREGNESYLGHIIEVGHGSVIEHGSATFIFHNVSRVFTHELVRHRAGTAISQESMRFVRIAEDGIPFWFPDASNSDGGNDLLSPTEREEEKAIMEDALRDAEKHMARLAKLYNLEDKKQPFSRKKKLTSRQRRIIPDGVATSIVWTCNLRSLRHVIEMRTAPGAEEEIRLVFGIVGRLAKKKWPNIFADYLEEVVDELPWFRTDHTKV